MATKIVKPIILEIDGTTYTLEFNRSSVVSAERIGLNIEDLQRTPLTTISLLFFCAFRMHHPEITHSESDSILFDKLCGGTEEMVKRLAELYAVPTSALFKYNEGNAKNVKISL